MSVRRRPRQNRIHRHRGVVLAHGNLLEKFDGTPMIAPPDRVIEPAGQAHCVEAFVHGHPTEARTISAHVIASDTPLTRHRAWPTVMDRAKRPWPT